MKLRLLAASFALVLAACGGGSSSTTPVAPVATATPFVAPQGAAVMTLTFYQNTASGRAQASARQAQFVSSAVANYQFKLNSVQVSSTDTTAVAIPSGVPTTTPATGVSPLTCSGGVCTLSVAVVPGYDNITVNLYDNFSTPRLLSTVTTNITIAQGAVNSPQITMQPLVASVVLTPTAGTAGTASSPALSVVAKDAASVTITSTGTTYVTRYATPIVLASTDTTLAGSTFAVTTTQTSPAANTVYGPDDTVTYAYTGKGYNAAFPATATVGGTNVTGTNGTLTVRGAITVTSGGSALPNDAYSSSDTNYGDPTLYFYSTTASPSTVTISEPGYSDTVGGSRTFALGVASTPTGNAAACTTLALSISASPAVTYSIAPSGLAGFCNETITDSLGQSYSFFISVTGLSLGAH